MFFRGRRRAFRVAGPVSVAVLSRMRRLIEHFRLFVRLLFATGADGNDGGEETECGELVHEGCGP